MAELGGRERYLGEPGERIDQDHGIVRARQNRDRWLSTAPLRPIGLRSAGRASGNTVHRPFSWKEGASAASALQVNNNCRLAMPCARSADGSSLPRTWSAGHSPSHYKSTTGSDRASAPGYDATESTTWRSRAHRPASRQRRTTGAMTRWRGLPRKRISFRCPWCQSADWQGCASIGLKS